MKNVAIALTALVFAGVASSTAPAAPLAGIAAVQKAVPGAAEQVRDRDDRRWDRHDRRWDRRDWRHDRRYYRYRHWNRYNHRPYNWRSRGCIDVGPFWFCR